MSLIFSISGLRGTIGDGLTPTSIIKYTLAFHHLLKGKRYLVGRDTRPHSPWILSIVTGVLNALGADVVNLNIVPTPSLVFGVRNSQADGGVIITASHNPENWNALKFVGRKGMFLLPDEIEKMKSLVKESPKWAPHDRTGTTEVTDNVVSNHIDSILSELAEKLDKVRSRKPKVIVDCVNGAMYEALPSFMESLGLKTIKLFCKPTGKFPHNPEPNPGNVNEIDTLLKEGEGDLGFAVDPDGDRLIFGLKGRGMLSEEYTLPVAINEVLKSRRGTVVLNLSTSMLSEHIAEQYGVPIVRAPVGEINVTKKLLEVRGVIGGEGNGGVIYPPINLCRDGLVASAFILSAYGEGDLIELLDSLPRYYRVKTKVSFQAEINLTELTEIFHDAEVDTQDGLYFRWEDMWLHVRRSNTEPVIRILGEGLDRRELKSKVSRIKDWLNFCL